LAAEASAADTEGERLPEQLDLDIHGFVQMDTIYDFNRVDPDWDATLWPSRIPNVAGEFGQDGETIFSVRQTRPGLNSCYRRVGDMRGMTVLPVPVQPVVWRGAGRQNAIQVRCPRKLGECPQSTGSCRLRSECGVAICSHCSALSPVNREISYANLRTANSKCAGTFERDH